MKYFTPELIVMGRSEDGRVLDEQSRLWEEGGERYTAYLDSVRARFPAGLRKIDETYYLHDAIVCSMGRRNQTFVMVLRLDPPSQSILTFTYDLIEDPVIIKDAVPQTCFGIGPLVEWQYNEIEMVDGDPPTWRESLLLSNGWEVRLHFQDARVEEAQAVLPIPGQVAPGISFILQHAGQA
jgi:hypothetical protein